MEILNENTPHKFVPVAQAALASGMSEGTISVAYASPDEPEAMTGVAPANKLEL